MPTTHDQLINAIEAQTAALAFVGIVGALIFASLVYGYFVDWRERRNRGE